MEPRVSVVIPTYERRELVQRAIRSALRQTFDSLEVIVVDDGSTDGTAAALDGWDGRVRCLPRPHRGAAAARNAGIEAARGDIVAFLDSDDRWRPQHLARLVRAFEEEPRAVLATVASFPLAVGLVDPLPGQLLVRHVEFPSATAVRRDVLVAVGGFDESLPTDEDGDLWLRLAFRGSFAIVRGRTVVVQATRDSMWQRDRRSGDFLIALERSSSRLVGDLKARKHPLLPRAEGRLELAHALRALEERDLAAVEIGLRRACALLPELSVEAEPVVWRITSYVPAADTPEGALRVLATAAELWPDRKSPTAVLLRCSAALMALRCGRPNEARRLAASLPPGATLRFAARLGSVAPRVARRRIHRALHRGRESGVVLRDDRA